MPNHNKPASSKTAPTSHSTFLPGSDPLAVAPSAVATIAARLTGFAAAPATYDPKAAETLLEVYRPRLLAIAPDQLKVPRLQLDAVCGALLTAHALTQSPALLERYQGSATAGAFDLGNLGRLKDLAFILLHVFRKAEAAGAFTSNAKISADLDAQSSEVETRIQEVCEHFFGKHKDIGPVLVQLSPGTSYLDRAHDLLGYADIYEANLGIVSTDPVHYRDTDIADARELAAKILAAIGASMTPQAREAYDLVLRAWTLVQRVYFEVREVGLSFLRYDPQRAARFPSLHVVGRPGKAGKKTKKAPSTGKAEAPKPDTD